MFKACEYKTECEYDHENQFCPDFKGKCTDCPHYNDTCCGCQDCTVLMNNQ